MRTKRMLRSLGILLFALLAACSSAPTPKVDDAAGTRIVATFMAQITQTAAAADDLPATVEPTETLTGESPEETETPYASPAPDPNLALLSRFRTVTVSQGNLYVRDGLGVPVQITKSGKDHDPVISSDGKKIAFYRGEKNNNVYMINADGTGEQDIVNKAILPMLDNAEVKFLTFRPRTHELLFDTYVCDVTSCKVDIHRLNPESAKITEIPSGYLDIGDKRARFEISPDGKYLAIINNGQINVHDMDGLIIQSAIVKVDKIFSDVSWLAASNTLIVFTAADGYDVFRYILKEKRIEKLSLDPAPAVSDGRDCGFSISPSGTWLLYANHQKHYLRNLQDVQSQTYSWNGGCDLKWSADSQHFSSSVLFLASQNVIGSVDGTPPIPIDGHFIAWLDATHYLFSKGKNILDLQSYIAEVGKESAAAPTNFIWSPVYAVLP